MGRQKIMSKCKFKLTNELPIFWVFLYYDCKYPLSSKILFKKFCDDMSWYMLLSSGQSLKNNHWTDTRMQSLLGHHPIRHVSKLCGDAVHAPHLFQLVLHQRAIRWCSTWLEHCTTTNFKVVGCFACPTKVRPRPYIPGVTCAETK